ncbi:MAG: hypothetical protein GC152_00250 [Alphaproteobacteria bacterium]|nr:hypothetical protein [Alphaproteobacteria bacterium]
MLSIVAIAAMIQSSPDTTPPQLIREDDYASCACPSSAPDDIIEIDGVVRDAELRLAPNGKSVLPEQATVFTVISASDESISGTVKVHHSTEPAKCGLAFDYGKRYLVRAVRKGDRLTSSYCLDPRRAVAD